MKTWIKHENKVKVYSDLLEEIDNFSSAISPLEVLRNEQSHSDADLLNRSVADDEELDNCYGARMNDEIDGYVSKLTIQSPEYSPIPQFDAISSPDSPKHYVKQFQLYGNKSNDSN